MKDENRPGSRPWSLMGSEDINLVSSQRLETALNSQRVYQAENLPQTYRCAPSSVVGNQRRGADSGRKTARGPIGVGTGGFPEPGKLYLRDFRGGLYGSDDGRPDSGAGNVNINGGLSMKAMVGRNAAAGRATPPEWNGREGESDEEDEDDDDDEDDGDGEMEGEVEGMVSVDGRQDTVDNNTANGNSNTANSGSNAALEGFQKGGLDREGGIPKTAMQNPSLGMFLSPPFLGSFPSPSGASAMLDATSAGHATSTGQNGGAGVSASSGFYRDGLLKDASSVARENNNNNNNNNSNNNNNNVHNNSTTLHHHTHQQGRIGHPSPMGHGEGALTVGPVSDSDHYYTQLLQSTGPLAQKEAGVEDKGTVANTESSETSLRTILSDPLTGVLMDDAMILSCGHSFGSGGLQHVLEARVCLSCGQPITNDSMAPNHALRAAVQAYRREEEYQSLSSKLAKRRRDKFEQDKVGFSDPVPMDCSRGKGVQFPFVVNDRVIIKGNKRTPDRFVGREAVITTQCLNGWYVVKTLDNAETVKLQYRSLLKVGEHQSSNEISQKALGPTWL